MFKNFFGKTRELPPREKKGPVLNYLAGTITLTALAAMLNVSEAEAKTIAEHYEPNKENKTIDYTPNKQAEAYNPFATVKTEDHAEEEGQKGDEFEGGGDGPDDLDALSEEDREHAEEALRIHESMRGSIDLSTLDDNEESVKFAKDTIPKVWRDDAYGLRCLDTTHVDGGNYNARLYASTEGGANEAKLFKTLNGAAVSKGYNKIPDLSGVPRQVNYNSKIHQKASIEGLIPGMQGAEYGLFLNFGKSASQLVELSSGLTVFEHNGYYYLHECDNLLVFLRAAKETKKPKPKVEKKEPKAEETEEPTVEHKQELVAKLALDISYQNGDRQIIIQILDRNTPHHTNVYKSGTLYLTKRDVVNSRGEVVDSKYVQITEDEWETRQDMHSTQKLSRKPHRNTGWEERLENQDPLPKNYKELGTQYLIDLLTKE